MLNRVFYELLPAIYLVLGLGLIFLIESDLRWIPAVFFLINALLISGWRIKNRLKKAEQS
ncbi:hypothetical protein [Pleionea sp. CnH1-48]|uniref:hypothetical protein n=1 Tax=Pleionea sp. CnH1-48 TaxID=2954494 RepID=UPI002096FE2F|nr:hypothetical protein [Pleionea sp. CnH1-48]MCO7226217.1 hypothetical protein [Pleionea sp. CnH1-48]